MSITSERIREQGFFHALADDAADEIESLERKNGKLLQLLEGIANMMRGMIIDPSIPAHAKGAMRSRIAEIDADVEKNME